MSCCSKIPKPFVLSAEGQSVGVNTPTSVIIKGGYFTHETVVDIVGQTITSINVIDDDCIEVFFTTGNTTGMFDVIVNNGQSTVLSFGYTVYDLVILTPGDGTTNWVRVASTLNTLGKTVPSSTASGWNKGASFGIVPAGKDFILEFNPAYMAGQSAGGYAMIGMDNADPNFNYNTIDFAMYLQNGTNLYVYENGASRGVFGSWTTSDVLAVQRQGTTITYLRNGVVFYTSTISSATAMVFDNSLYRYLGAENIKLTYFN